ncbi:unnamed protein product [Dovyalis caffra]|uniref:Uncharacterized protein n=1 Tax=Dovyalis caffra TaxID=77055 RepID=A0AAV1QSS2_9ROSI|nr:unnamed protein product [Dovyalis caffra]
MGVLGYFSPISRSLSKCVLFSGVKGYTLYTLVQRVWEGDPKWVKSVSFGDEADGVEMFRLRYLEFEKSRSLKTLFGYVEEHQI